MLQKLDNAITMVNQIMHILFSGQKKWARGKTPEEATKYLKKFLKMKV